MSRTIVSGLRNCGYRYLVGCILFVMAAALPATAQERVTHTVQAGENLYRIALRYGVTMDALISANNITSPSRIFAGTVLVIPGLEPAANNPEGAVNPLVATAPVTHTVQRGESLTIIARRYNVTAQSILQANNIANANIIYPGQVLQIWTSDLSVAVNAETPQETSAQAVPDAAPSYTLHTVRQGEYLSQIARNYGVSWTSIAEANGITDPNRIYAGLQLRIPSTGSVASTDMGIIAQGVNHPGPRWGTGREIVVVLSTQMTYAYENGQLVRSVLSSTGLPATPTVQGDYRVYRKYDAQLMAGPGYYLPGVPWVMYFYQGYALHGAYWHNNFGQPMSHGCVNLPIEEARWFYEFADIGTPVHVRWA